MRKRHTGGPRLMQILLVQISLMQFLKTFHKYLPFANFWLFISLVQFFGQKIALMKKIAKNSHKANFSNETNSQKIALAKYLANTKFG